MPIQLAKREFVYDCFVRVDRLPVLQKSGCSAALIVGARLFNLMLIHLTCDPLTAASPLSKICSYEKKQNLCDFWVQSLFPNY